MHAVPALREMPAPVEAVVMRDRHQVVDASISSSRAEALFVLVPMNGMHREHANEMRSVA